MWCSKVGIVVVLSSLHSSHHCPAAASCHRHRLHCRLRSSTQLTPVAQCRCRWQLAAHSLQPHAEPFGSWSAAAAAAAAAAQFASDHASGASFTARTNAVWRFWGWQCRTGQDRLLIQCLVCEASCLKVVQFSDRRHANLSCSLCASDGLCPAPARAGLLSLSLVLSYPPLQLLLTIAHQLFSVQSRAAASFV